MKKIVSGLLLLCLTISMQAQEVKKVVHHKSHHVQTQPMVYICNSGSAYAYHSSNGCHGLGRCRHTISRVTLSEAKNEGYRACKICY